MLVFCRVSYACPSLDRCVQGCPNSLRALRTTQALPEGQPADSLSSRVQLRTKLLCARAWKPQKRTSVQDAAYKLHPDRFYKTLRNPPPLPAFPCHASQQPASYGSRGLRPLIPLGLLGSLSSSDRMHTAISYGATGRALATLSNSLWDWQPCAPEGIRNTTGRQLES